MTEILPVPAEVQILGTYFPPLLIAFLLGIIAMVLTVKALNRYRMSRFIVYPNLVMLAILVIYTVLFGTFLFPS